MSDVGVVVCPHCNARMKFPLSKTGKSGKCPKCWQPITLKNELIVATVVDPPPAPQELAATSPSPVEPDADAREIVPARHEDSRLSKFISDGQPTTIVGKLLGRVEEVCTSTENVEYLAVQHLPNVMSPDALALTNRRIIILRQKALGRMKMIDRLWRDVRDVSISEGVVGASITVEGLDGLSEKIDHLPKPQARAVYRVAQEREEAMIEHRRQQKMEEDRNAAGNVVVNTAVANPSPTTTEDPVSRLAKLKAMLEQNLISQEEFDSKKAEILGDL